MIIGLIVLCCVIVPALTLAMIYVIADVWCAYIDWKRGEL